MAKRSAAIQINDSNWDAEEESEEAGQFKIAGAAELSQRVIKKAKRRVPEGEVSTNSFKGFQGFGTTEKIGQKTTSTFAGFQGFSKQAKNRYKI
ncbi:nuclear pore complex protein Nup50-like [Xenia sp. Carnegie-2017]|uniref:nuclear pore complex protein Nup50-like n=1 Tax=Xenia sp. Carnegie-2017 TaxID=2897299 RepID=UPI001F0338C8|nr:nuclear pore complex protein Nup50-like [Xenia sp. Carnegie-2017]